MPKMNGSEFLAEYAILPGIQKARVIIIMLTTSLNPEDRRKAERIQEITGFEVKPLTHEMLQKILELHFNDE
jgi:CheY-like chemotaxis protein